MAMQGDLKDMSVADLIQHNCQDGKTAALEIEAGGQQATLYFEAGEVVHAALGNQSGEPVVYEVLPWEEGHFVLHPDQGTTIRSIDRSWSGLLLEGARRLDEAEATSEAERFNFIDPSQEDKPMAKKRSEVLAETLEALLRESSDIDGAAIVGVDGLVYSANVPQRALDEDMVGASSAAVLGLSRRSVDQLKRGTFKQTLIQGDDGNIIVAGLNGEALFIGLTPANVNLGMAFAEVRSITRELAELV